MTDGTSNTKEVTRNIDAAFVRYRSWYWSYTAITAVAAIIKINSSWLFVLLIFIIDGTQLKVTDIFVWITVMLLQNTVRWVSSQLSTLRCCLSYCMGVRPNKQATICAVMLFSNMIIDPRYLVVDSYAQPTFIDNNISCSSSFKLWFSTNTKSVIIEQDLYCSSLSKLGLINCLTVRARHHTWWLATAKTTLKVPFHS